MYRIHPALPGYLAAGWRREDSGNHDAARETAARALLTAHAAFGGWLRRQIESGECWNAGLDEEAGAWADLARLATEDPDGSPGSQTPHGRVRPQIRLISIDVFPAAAPEQDRLPNRSQKRTRIRGAETEEKTIGR